MIRHIVEFKLTADDPVQRDNAIDGIRRRLSALIGVVPGLRTVTVAKDLGYVAGHWSVVLISDHDDNAALEGYQAHPAHREAASWISTVVNDRAIVDFELDG